MKVVFALYFLYEENRILLRNLRIVLYLETLSSYSFDDIRDCLNLFGWGGISLKADPIFQKNFLDFGSYTNEKYL